jgi:hypothetical protein
MTGSSHTHPQIQPPTRATIASTEVSASASVIGCRLPRKSGVGRKPDAFTRFSQLTALNLL